MADVLQATYADLKTVKTRSTCQLILELPIEALTDVVALLGAPVPGNEVWVAVARLRGKQEPSEPEEQEQQPQIEAPLPKPPARMSQSAGIISNEGAFATFMRDVKGYAHTIEPAEALRLFCGIESRRELDDTMNSSARANFMTLKSEYEAWLRCDGVAA